MKTKLIELATKREALKAEMERANSEMLAKIADVEYEMIKAREATVTVKVGDVIETTRGPVKVAKVYVHYDDVSVYGFRKTPSGRWSKKRRTVWDTDLPKAEGEAK